jgi:hypothetical protein
VATSHFGADTKGSTVYDDVLGIAGSGAAGTGAVLAVTGTEVGSLLVLAWGLALGGTAMVALAVRLKANKTR